MFTSIAASNDFVVACEGTDLHVPDIVHVMKSGKEIASIDMPPDLDSTHFKQSVCDRIEGGLIIDATEGAIYVAMADMYGKSAFGASLIKIDSTTFKIATRLKMPVFRGPVSATKGTSPGAMMMTPHGTLLLSDCQGRFHVVDLKTFNFTKTVTLPENLCEDAKPEATSIAFDSESNVAFLNVCGNVHRLSLQTMQITSSLKGSFIESELFYTDGHLLAYANVPGPGVYDHGTPKFMRITVSKTGEMTLKDELSLAAVETNQFFGDGSDGAYFVAHNYALFTGAEKAPCPDVPGQGCPHEITKVAAVRFPAHGQLELGKAVGFAHTFTAITNIARKSAQTLEIAGYSGTPLKASIIEVPVHNFSFVEEPVTRGVIVM